MKIGCGYSLVFLLLISCLYGEMLTGTDGKVSVKAEISSTTISMAEEIIVDVSFEPSDISDAKITISGEEFTLRQLTNDEGRIKTVLVPKFPGEYDLLLMFEYLNSDTEQSVFGLGKIDVVVASTLTEEETQALMQGDYSPIIGSIERITDVETSPYDYRFVAAAALGAILAAVAVILIIRKIRGKKIEEKSYVIVHNIAYRLLDDLQFMGLPRSGKFKIYYTNLSSILRYYIEYRFDIHAPDMTTEEFLDKVRYSEELSSAKGGSIEKFFEICDMVKFAKFQPTESQATEAIDSVREFVSRTEDYLCVVEKSAGEKFASVLEGFDEAV